MHRWSQLFIPTLREAPADAEVASHKFLVRAGYIRQLAAGLYSFLFLGNRSMVKIARIVREEMDCIGQEFHLPALHPRARRELRSYKQLPQIWYQIQSKFRDEPRPKSGLLRLREFMMKDSYSFDLDATGLDISYQKHYDAYCRIFGRCGLTYIIVEAHSGAIGQLDVALLTGRSGPGYRAQSSRMAPPLLSPDDAAWPEDRQGRHGAAIGCLSVLDAAPGMGLSAVDCVRFARGAARKSPRCAVKHRAIDWAPRSSSPRSSNR